MLGREVKLPDLLAYVNKIEEPQFHTDYAVDQQALLKDVHDWIWAYQWNKVHSNDAGECMYYKPDDFSLVDSRKRSKGASSKLKPN